MALTPEGKVKAKLKRELTACGAFNYWPVPSGYGQQMVDCIAVWKSCPYFIECKREGETKPTPRQAAIMRAIRKAGALTYVVSMKDGELLWLEQKD